MLPVVSWCGLVIGPTTMNDVSTASSSSERNHILSTVRRNWVYIVLQSIIIKREPPPTPPLKSWTCNIFVYQIAIEVFTNNPCMMTEVIDNNFIALHCYQIGQHVKRKLSRKFSSRGNFGDGPNSLIKLVRPDQSFEKKRLPGQGKIGLVLWL